MRAQKNVPPLSVRLNERLKSRLESEAESLGLDLSNYVRMILTRRDFRIIKGGKK